MAPPAKRQKLSPTHNDEHADNDQSETTSNHHSDEEARFTDTTMENASTDTDAEIENARHRKSSKTLKRKHRATDAVRFGATLEHLLRTDVASSLPLSLKPSIPWKHNEEKLEAKGKKILLVEKKEREERGRVKDVIGGWGGECERALRKVAQRGVVKLFNTIQQSQIATTVAMESLKAQRGSGKPTLPAPLVDHTGGKKGKQRSKQQPRPLGSSASSLDQKDFLESIRLGSIVSKA